MTSLRKSSIIYEGWKESVGKRKAYLGDLSWDAEVLFKRRSTMNVKFRGFTLLYNIAPSANLVSGE